MEKSEEKAGRVQIQKPTTVVKRIENSKARRLSYLKRKECVMKKTMELSTLCGIKACTVCFGPNGEVETWPKHPTHAKSILNMYQDNHNHRHRHRHRGGGQSVLEKTDRSGEEGEETVTKQDGLSLKNVLSSWKDEWLLGLSTESLTNFLKQIDLKLEAVEGRIDSMKKIDERSNEKGDAIAYRPLQSTLGSTAAGGGGYFLDPVVALMEAQTTQLGFSMPTLSPLNYYYADLASGGVGNSENFDCKVDSKNYKYSRSNNCDYHQELSSPLNSYDGDLASRGNGNSENFDYIVDSKNYKYSRSCNCDYYQELNSPLNSYYGDLASGGGGNSENFDYIVDSKNYKYSRSCNCDYHQELNSVDPNRADQNLYLPQLPAPPTHELMLATVYAKPLQMDAPLLPFGGGASNIFYPANYPSHN